MEDINLTINGEQTTIQAAPDTPILWVLREQLGLTGTKYGCGKALCGSCVIHLDGNPVRACVTPAAAVADRKLTTIEGLGQDDKHPLQKAWISAQAPQCGYCQPGQIMQAAALLEENNNPSREEIVTHMKGNLCRCGAYLRILKAIEMAAQNQDV